MIWMILGAASLLNAAWWLLDAFGANRLRLNDGWDRKAACRKAAVRAAVFATLGVCLIALGLTSR